MGNSFSDVDFSAYDKVIFLSSEKIKCYDDVKFSKNLEFPNSSDVDLSFCDLQNVHSILFGWYDLKECTNLSFKDGADIGFAFARGLPHNLDVSKCREVSFFKCDMKDISSVSFKDGAKVNLQEARNLPPHTDFSTCSILMLTNCNLKDQTELRFRDGAEVYLQEACNLPKQLDFSMCKDGEVWLKNCDFTGVERLVFKNRTQYIESSACVSGKWTGKLVFADEQPQADLTNMAYMANAKGGR